MNRRCAVEMVILAAVSIALFTNTLDNGFVWDDWLVHLDSAYKRLSPSVLVQFFSGGTPYPLSGFFSAVNYSVWGPNATGYHAMNILVHTGTVVLIYILFRVLIGGARKVAAFQSAAASPSRTSRSRGCECEVSVWAVAAKALRAPSRTATPFRNSGTRMCSSGVWSRAALPGP